MVGGGYPIQLMGGVPHPADGGGVPHSADDGGYPGWGVPQPGGGGTLVGGYPGGGYLGRGGTPVLVTPQLVCLLRSRRRTFL